MKRLSGRRILRLVFGRPLATSEQESEQLTAAQGVPVLGLDALASAAYGPEAALTVFALAGVAGLGQMTGIVLAIVGILLLVQFSYRQTISTHPDGGGSYTVARENLGVLPGLLAASALIVDYLLNVAVAISAGVGALVSAFPALLPHTLALCLGILAFITIVNLRGLRESGLVFLAPTYLFIASLGGVLAYGAWKALAAHGAPEPVIAPPSPKGLAHAASVWLVLRAFASGCTAMTGIEAVSNAVPAFREPRAKRAERTLAIIVGTLVTFLLGITFLARAYHLTATEPGKPGYESVISMLVHAVVGHGPVYALTVGSVIAVLCLSANTSFAGFPRLCRLLALSDFLPEAFAHQGRRLVYSTAIVLLSACAGALLVAFGGVTDRLIPLFAVGALAAFTLSQAGMVAYWRRHPGRRRSMALNLVGAIATGATLLVVAISKFEEGAWVSIGLIGLLMALLLRTHRHYTRVRMRTAAQGPLQFTPENPPIVVVPLRRLDQLAYKALRLGLSISSEVYACEVRAASVKTEDLGSCWHRLVEEPVRAAGLEPPTLVVMRSEYRDVVDPLLRFVRRLKAENPGRRIAVIIPEVVERRWYHYLLHSHTATAMRLMLFFRGAPEIVVVSTPWYLDARPARPWAPRTQPVLRPREPERPTVH